MKINFRNLTVEDEAFYKADIKRMAVDNPKGFALPNKAIAVFAVLAFVLTGFMYLMFSRICAVLALCMVLCVFVLSDTLLSLKKDPPTKKMKKILSVSTCAFSGLALVVFGIMLTTYIQG